MMRDLSCRHPPSALSSVPFALAYFFFLSCIYSLLHALVSLTLFFSRTIPFLDLNFQIFSNDSSGQFFAGSLFLASSPRLLSISFHPHCAVTVCIHPFIYPCLSQSLSFHIIFLFFCFFLCLRLRLSPFPLKSTRFDSFSFFFSRSCAWFQLSYHVISLLSS